MGIRVFAGDTIQAITFSGLWLNDGLEEDFSFLTAKKLAHVSHHMKPAWELSFVESSSGSLLIPSRGT